MSFANLLLMCPVSCVIKIERGIKVRQFHNIITKIKSSHVRFLRLCMWIPQHLTLRHWYRAEISRYESSDDSLLVQLQISAKNKDYAK